MASPRVPALLAIVLLAGCAAQESAPPASPTPAAGDEAPRVSWRPHVHLGSILADAQGRTLYVSTEDPSGASACVGECAVTWPPVTTSEASVPEGASLGGRLATLARGEGARQLAIDGRPLYRYAHDEAPGDANGQAVGGTWFALRESDAPGRLNVDFLDGPGAFNVTGENVTEGDARGYFARPATEGAFPGVVMIHEWWGLNEHIRQMADALASHGYLVFAVDLYEGTVAATPQEAQAQVRALDQAAANATMRAAAAWLREEGARAVASLGWCFGGGQSLRLALSGEALNATVIYYGALVTDEAQLGAIGWPVLGVFGAEDASIPVADVRAFEAALNRSGVEHEIHVYDGAEHAFANPSGQAYRPAAAMDAWAKTLAFLERHLR